MKIEKITPQKVFEPVALILETQHDVDVIAALLNSETLKRRLRPIRLATAIGTEILQHVSGEYVLFADEVHNIVHGK